MAKIIGIRREDKNKWERRVPLIPDDIRELKEQYGIQTIIQPSNIRIFSDDAYRQAGAIVSEDLSPASVIAAVKEIPISMYEKDKTYVFFSHTIKAQSYNMPMLKKIMDLGCNLIDYERIVNEKNQRLIFFGRYAGCAGMIDTLHALGQKLKLLGYDTPLEQVKSAYEYESLEHAFKAIEAIGDEIGEKGLPESLAPLVIGFSGYGNVSRGAQEIFNLLPHKVVSANILNEMYENFTGDVHNFYKVIFSEDDMVRPRNREIPFNLQDYYDHPENYESRFEQYLPLLTVLVNGIFWSEKYPRLVTKEYLNRESSIRGHLPLKVIGDISCDIDGGVEITHKATKPDNPSFTYFPIQDCFEDGVQRDGITVMAVDNLPCEFSKESSSDFSHVLKQFIHEIAEADFSGTYESLALPYPIRKGLIVHKGTLTPEYRYLEEHIK